MKLKAILWSVGVFTASWLTLGVVARAADLGGSKDISQPYVSNNGVNWSGVYVGGQVGYGWNEHTIGKKGTDGSTSPDTTTFGVDTVDTDGVLGGFRAGVNYQPKGTKLLFGAFAQYDFSDSTFTDDTTKSVLSDLSDGDSYLVGGRVGAIFNDRVLGYGLVGYGNQTVSYTPKGVDTIDASFEHVVVGGGIEYKAYDAVSVGIEYQRWLKSEEEIKYGSKSFVDNREDNRFMVFVNYNIGM